MAFLGQERILLCKPHVGIFCPTLRTQTLRCTFVPFLSNGLFVISLQSGANLATARKLLGNNRVATTSASPHAGQCKWAIKRPPTCSPNWAGSRCSAGCDSLIALCNSSYVISFLRRLVKEEGWKIPIFKVLRARPEGPDLFHSAFNNFSFAMLCLYYHAK